MPVKVADAATGCTIMHKRNPELGMQFQCYHGSVMLLHDSVHRHHPCAKLCSVTTGTAYFLILSSERELADVQNDNQSEVEEEEEELLDVSGYQSVVPWQAQMQLPIPSSNVPNMLSLNAQHTTFIMGALQFQQGLSQQQQQQLSEKQ